MRDVLFVSWCGLKLLRPRALQVGRAAKALVSRSWSPQLICAEFNNDSDIFDLEIESWYRPNFRKVMALADPDFMRRAKPQEKAAGPLARLFGNRRSEDCPRPWADAAADETRRWVRWRRRPIVVSFGQPWTSHLAVLAAKQSFPRLRWAAHFSDPWTDSPYLEQKEGEGFETAQRQEREIISQADAVVFVTEDTADLVMRKYPSEWRHKVHIIPHLLDLKMPTPRASRRRRDQLTFVHTGSLYEGTRAPSGLFEALRELLDADSRPNLPLSFNFVGWTPAHTIDSIRDLSEHGCISWTTPLYYSPSLKQMADADVLVVIDADFEISPFLPSKISDYLLFDRPMLGLTPPGSATARFLGQLGYPCVGPNDVEGIKRALLELLDAWRVGELKPTAAHLKARQTLDVHGAGMRYVDLLEGMRW